MVRHIMLVPRYIDRGVLSS